MSYGFCTFFSLRTYLNFLSKKKKTDLNWSLNEIDIRNPPIYIYIYFIWITLIFILTCRKKGQRKWYNFELGNKKEKEVEKVEKGSM